MRCTSSPPPEFRPGVEERFAAILAALGEDEERDRTAPDLIPGLVGSPIYREQNPLNSD